jgi:hypothetical protein
MAAAEGAKGAGAALRVAVIADGALVPRFGLEALEALGPIEVTLFSCTNTRLPKRAFRHAFYYALNLVSVRNPWTKLMPLPPRVPVAETVPFEAGLDGAWQTLPADVIARLAGGGFDFVLKLGMGLLRVPERSVLPVPILSYHHGDPDKYRGRPAGFWEMLAGEPLMGQMVQVIGNRLDGGDVVAFAETKIFPWSYRATLVESYRHSPLIIAHAVRNVLAGTPLPKPCSGRNHRLPSNGEVIGFLLRMAVQFVRRLLYGALMEKRWHVSTAAFADEARAGLVEGRGFPPAEAWATLQTPPRYVFYADPFFSEEPEGLLVEALKRGTGIGEIVLVSGDEHSAVSDCPGHMSYPATFDHGGRRLIVPEMAAWSAPKIFALEGGAMKEVGALRLETPANLLDPTLVDHEGRTWLFANDRALGSNTLFLWSADDLSGVFRPHPASPIRISPRGARMAGNILRLDGRLIRFGQDFSFGYGDGIHAYEIVRLTPEAYEERPIGSLRFADRRGPHTLNFSAGRVLFDWYFDSVSPLAGLRRLSARRQD